MYCRMFKFSRPDIFRDFLRRDNLFKDKRIGTTNTLTIALVLMRIRKILSTLLCTCLFAFVPTRYDIYRQEKDRKIL